MLKKLKLKFVIINMSIVTVILCTIFSLLYFSTSKNLKNESIEMMETVVTTKIKPGPPGKRPNNVNLPYFVISINKENVINNIESNFFDLSDLETVNTLLQATIESTNDIGLLKEYNLRFLKAETLRGKNIVFVDISNEQSILNHLLLNFLLVGSASFMLFLIISIYLANWAVKPVDKAWQMQKQFVGDASHELKTPLTVILTDTELLNNEKLTENQRKDLITGISTMALQMRGLVENLLDLARVDHQHEPNQLSDVNFSETIEECILNFEPVFFEKQLTLNSDITKDIYLSGNESELKQLVNILLDNAVKYSLPQGDTTIKLQLNKHKNCLLTVSNKGEPIDKENLENIFKRFYRLDSVRTMNHSYGLGLAIGKSIVEKHNGRIWAESNEGYNHFYVTLPNKRKTN